MESTNTLDILKQAILLEKRGKIFYANAAANSKDPDVKNIFEIMTREEDEHIQFLVEQMKNYQDGGKFDFQESAEKADHTLTDQVITKNISERITAVSFEAAAISLAIDMENRAIDAYATRGAKATDPDEKRFYLWLADWERGHHRILYELDQELKEKIWMDNNFWAF
jgi:rubrerythrin